MHTTQDVCCPEGVTLQIRYCSRIKCYRISGQWCPEQLQFFDDSVHDVEIIVSSSQEIRGAVVQVLKHYQTLLNLSPSRVCATE